MTDHQFNQARHALTVWMIQKAHRIAKDFEINYEPSENAPNDFEALKLSYRDAKRNRTPLPVWSGASDATIYTSPEGNYAFRFVHDVLHVVFNADFSVQGESVVTVHHAKMAAEYFGADSLEYKMLLADGLGQVFYMAQHGQFPVDQLAYVKSTMTTF